jgi:hypothetical protein
MTEKLEGAVLCKCFRYSNSNSNSNSSGWSALAYQPDTMGALVAVGGRFTNWTQIHFAPQNKQEGKYVF